MPYKKSYRRYRKKFRPSFKKRVTQVIKSFAEKHVRNVSGSSEANSSGVLTELTNIARGSNSDQRTGDQIKTLSLLLRAIIIGNATIATHVVRIIVAKSRKGPLTIANFPAFSDNIDTDDMYPIYDKTFILRPTTTGSGSLPGKMVLSKWFKIPANIQYDDSSLASNNALYFAIISDDTPTFGATVDWAYHLNFVDN